MKIKKIFLSLLLLFNYATYGQTIPAATTGGIQTSITTNQLKVALPKGSGTPEHVDYQIFSNGTIYKTITYAVPAKRVPLKISASVSNRSRFAENFIFSNKTTVASLWYITITDSNGLVVWKTTDTVAVLPDPQIIKLLPARSFIKTVVIDPAFKAGTYHINAVLLASPSLEVSTIVILD